MKKIKEILKKIMWIKKKSADASCTLPNNLDFVYICGNQRYKFVKQDMRGYYPKLRREVLSCHDTDKPETMGAFAELVVAKNLKHGLVSLNSAIFKSSFTTNFQD
ncbi:MAG: hypothetical protein KJ718_01385 [Nanoarchaeota archaeon]|nr:hypothetical protein [Nanoarchaeota archaeon]MBU1051186.1 hypothetical protein [Nanoarchaeota archaeon]MBU1988080.1 hypothetical protein [Nanoarchaeota archaeon]